MSTCENIGPLLDGYHDRELESVERLHVERHLESCADCRRDLVSLDDVGRAVRATVEGSQAPDLWQAIAAQLPSATARRRAPLRARAPQRRRWLPAAAVAAAAAVFGVVIGYQRDLFPSFATEPGPSGVVRSIYAPGRPVIVYEAERSEDPTLIWLMDETTSEVASHGRL